MYIYVCLVYDTYANKGSIYVTLTYNMAPYKDMHWHWSGWYVWADGVLKWRLKERGHQVIIMAHYPCAPVIESLDPARPASTKKPASRGLYRFFHISAFSGKSLEHVKIYMLSTSQHGGRVTSSILHSGKIGESKRLEIWMSDKIPITRQYLKNISQFPSSWSRVPDKLFGLPLVCYWCIRSCIFIDMLLYL